MKERPLPTYRGRARPSGARPYRRAHHGGSKTTLGSAHEPGLDCWPDLQRGRVVSNDYKPNEAAEKQQGQWSELRLWRMEPALQ
jgi:hypothetical protein